MKFQGELKNVNVQKKGIKMVIFIETEDKGTVLSHISEFIEKPITHEILVDADKVIENFDTISDDQRKKIYALIKDFAREYGESDTEMMKAELKTWYCESSGHPKFSLSNADKEIANEFIEYIIMMGKENGYEFAFRESQEDEGIKMDIVNQICSACGDSGEVKVNKTGHKICLCDTCFKNFRDEGTAFLDKHHIKLIKL